MKKLLVAILTTLGLAGAAYADVSPDTTKILQKKLRSECVDLNAPEGTICYASKVDTFYLRDGGRWDAVSPRNLEWSMSFDEGASKGLSLIEQDFTAYSTTADATNIVTYGYPPLRFQFSTNTTATATLTPTADAAGIDLFVGGGDNDEGTYTFGAPGTTGGPAIIGTTPAFKACMTVTMHDVSGSDGFFLEITNPGVPTDLSSGDPNYTSYCAIGNVSGDIKVSDNTTGATDTTNNWADDESHALCIKVSAAGACTYTIDGSAPLVTDAHTLSDGIPVVMRIQGIEASDLADDTWLTAASFSLQ